MKFFVFGVNTKFFHSTVRFFNITANLYIISIKYKNYFKIKYKLKLHIEKIEG